MTTHMEKMILEYAVAGKVDPIPNVEDHVEHASECVLNIIKRKLMIPLVHSVMS